MKKYIILIITFIYISCHHEIFPSDDPNPLIELSIPIVTEKAKIISRSASDESITDVNIYILNEQGLIYENHVHHTAVINLSLNPGLYTIYVIANYGQKIDFQSENQLRGLAVEFSPDDHKTLYTAIENIDLRAEPGRTAIKPITVKRVGTLINYNIKVSELLGLTIDAVRICNIPVLSGLFEEHGDNYYDNTDWDDLEILNSRAVADSFWMPENRRGTNAAIADQKDKSEKTAPSGATYIHIQTTFQGTIYYFRVYLGENNTTDFNVNRNTCHYVDITIRDINTIDTRISRSLVSITCPSNQEYFSLGEQCLYTVHAYCDSEDMEYKAELEVTGGSYTDFTLNGRQLNHTEVIPLVNNTANITLARTSNTLNTSDNRLDFIIRVIDKYGVIKEQAFFMYYGFTIEVLTSKAGPIANLGGYYIDDPLVTKTSYPGWNIISERHIFPPDARVTLIARPFNDINFEGWYYDIDYGRIYSWDRSLLLTKGNGTISLAPKFTY